MTDLKIDNPAQRLLDLLEKGRLYAEHQNCREVWKKILNVESCNEQVLITRLAKVMELPARISQVMDDHFSDSRWKSTHWKDSVESAFLSQELRGVWKEFKKHIDSQTLSELGLLSMTFETRGSHSDFDDEQIETLLEKIAELRNEIRGSELSAPMKTMLLRQLFKLQEALESYSISGVEPIMDAVQSTIGLAVVDANYRDEISKGTGTKFGERISDLLGDIANLVTIAGAIPCLPVAIHTALNYLSK
ncbi:hypothetical protein [Erwinia piriflorinigrans]|uniref:Uncharacterized protein n=1 Tax=Erwinia piriflorinigrans CFBP 5888 TaxID=1161919 RepID=V5Z3Z4_9GAMM|nr:hypothetical protein [Erwinia piriflorinigrans]CCG85987.1 hypothetical protein EPIR_0622 [Erwinia piriflorinigrans CFBP 5888]